MKTSRKAILSFLVIFFILSTSTIAFGRKPIKTYTTYAGGHQILTSGLIIYQVGSTIYCQTSSKASIKINNRYRNWALDVIGVDATLYSPNGRVANAPYKYRKNGYVVYTYTHSPHKPGAWWLKSFHLYKEGSMFIRKTFWDHEEF